MGPGIEATAIADLNKDGFLDLIFPEAGSGVSEVFWGTAAGYSADNVLRLKANGAPHAVPADLDNDGWLDLIFASGFSNEQHSVHTNTLIYWGSPLGFSEKALIAVEGFTTLDATVADFNRDGHLDIATTNYRSDTTRELPAFIYWGGAGRDFSEKRRTLLEAHSSSAIDSLDLNRDGWVDLVVSNHQKHFDHAAGTNIYWGGPEGFSSQRRHHIPTVGVHLDAMVDAGSVYDRRYEWDYTSAPVQAPAGAAFAALHWKAETRWGTGVKFQVRSAGTEEGLRNAPWKGPLGGRLLLPPIRNGSFGPGPKPRLAAVPGGVDLSGWRQFGHLDRGRHPMRPVDATCAGTAPGAVSKPNRGEAGARRVTSDCEPSRESGINTSDETQTLPENHGEPGAGHVGRASGGGSLSRTPHRGGTGGRPRTQGLPV